MYPVRPRKGDIWEFQLPGKPKRRKEVGKVGWKWTNVYDGKGNWIGQRKRMYVSWYRLPKGRYTGIRVRKLIETGKRLSTRAERSAAQEKRFARLEKAGF